MSICVLIITHVRHFDFSNKYVGCVRYSDVLRVIPQYTCISTLNSIYTTINSKLPNGFIFYKNGVIETKQLESTSQYIISHPS